MKNFKIINRNTSHCVKDAILNGEFSFTNNNIGYLYNGNGHVFRKIDPLNIFPCEIYGWWFSEEYIMIYDLPAVKRYRYSEPLYNSNNIFLGSDYYKGGGTPHIDNNICIYFEGYEFDKPIPIDINQPPKARIYKYKNYRELSMQKDMAYRVSSTYNNYNIDFKESLETNIAKFSKIYNDTLEIAQKKIEPILNPDYKFIKNILDKPKRNLPWSKEVNYEDVGEKCYVKLINIFLKYKNIFKIQN